jgi:hypothetical protein
MLPALDPRQFREVDAAIDTLVQAHAEEPHEPARRQLARWIVELKGALHE